MAGAWTDWRGPMLAAAGLLLAGCAPDRGLTPEQLFERSRPSILLIRAAPAGDAPQAAPESKECEGPPYGGGTGFVVDTAGHIVTNAHVVMPCPNSWPQMKWTVQLASGEQRGAILTGIDADFDIAVLQISGAAPKPLKFGDSDKVKAGQPVAAIGFPVFAMLGEAPSLSTGVISAPRRSFDYIGGGVQTDTAVNHGNSGGPLLDARGDVIGVNTMGVNDTTLINISISARVAQKVAGDLIATGKTRMADIGLLAYSPLNEGAVTANAVVNHMIFGVGLVVQGLIADGPSSQVLQACDLIRKIDGELMGATGDLGRALLLAKPGQTLTLEITRYPDGKCADAPDPNAAASSDEPFSVRYMRRRMALDSQAAVFKAHIDEGVPMTVKVTAR